MKKRKMVQPPKGSWLDKKGQRWIKLFFDVMSGFGGGEKFIRQVSVVFPVEFCFELGKYLVNINASSLDKMILKEYPSLRRYSDLHFAITSNKV